MKNKNHVARGAYMTAAGIMTAWFAGEAMKLDMTASPTLAAVATIGAMYLMTYGLLYIFAGVTGTKTDSEIIADLEARVTELESKQRD